MASRSDFLPNRAGQAARERHDLLSYKIATEPQIALLRQRFERWTDGEGIREWRALREMVEQFLAATSREDRGT